jgi:hypothetical protein
MLARFRRMQGSNGSDIMLALDVSRARQSTVCSVRCVRKVGRRYVETRASLAVGCPGCGITQVDIISRRCVSSNAVVFTARYSDRVNKRLQ